MGTVVEITVAHPDEGVARAAAETAFEEFERVDRLLSNYDASSEVSRINREAYGEEVGVSEELYRLLEEAVEVSRRSEGAFDITVGPLMDIWQFDEGGRLPGPEEIRTALESVGYERLRLDPTHRTVRFLVPGMKLDLGGIGKGYAVDLSVSRLREAGIEAAIIDAGGDLRLLGHRPGKSFWRIGVRHPREPSRLLLSLELEDTSVVTSGDYERFFMQDDVRYHHLLDPRSGYPASGCQSVTVIAPQTVASDAYATAAFVLGPAEGLDFLRNIEGVEGAIVDAGGNVQWTDELHRP